MNWKILSTPEQLDTLLANSVEKPQVIFKHSTRCSISSVVKTRLEKAGLPDTIDFHYLDLLSYRSLSNKIAEDLKVYHESPQILLVKNGECVYDESHLSIQMNEIIDQAGLVK
jgi:bacillithiol system protein YtxJ